MPKIAPPDWVFHTLGALTAAQVLQVDLSVDDFTGQASAALADIYPLDEALAADLWTLAVDMLEVLVVAEVDDAPQLCRAFAERCVMTVPGGGPRRFKRFFGSVIDAEEKSRFRVEEGGRALRQFIFAVSNGVRPVCSDDFPCENPPEIASLLGDFLRATYWFADDSTP